MTQTLPARYYVDASVFEAERTKIFSRSWWLLGPLRDLEHPGDYLADTVCGWPVFAIRDQQAFDWSAQIVHEDLAVCERVQVNLAAGVYEAGPLSPTEERHTARFQALVRAALGEF